MPGQIITNEQGLLARYSVRGAILLRYPTAEGSLDHIPAGVLSANDPTDALLAQAFFGTPENPNTELYADLTCIIAGDHWTDLFPYRIGYKDENELALIYSVSRGTMTSRRAAEVVIGAQKVLAKHDPRLAEVTIEVIEGDITAAGTSITNIRGSYAETPAPGSSIGPRGCELWSGTCGPYAAIIFRDGTVRQMLVTCHHVVSPSSTQAILPPSSATSGLEIVSPSDSDNELMCRVLEYQQRGSSDYGNSEHDDAAPAESEYERVKGFDRTIGRLFLTSGLTKFPDKQPISNAPSTTVSHAYVQEGITGRVPDWEHLKPAGFRRRAKGNELTLDEIRQIPRRGGSIAVFKNGRSTLQTAGRMPFGESPCVIQYTIGGDRDEGFKFTLEAKALRVLSDDGEGLSSHFGQTGDSGSLVVDKDGRAVGIIIGRHTVLNNVYVLPWSVLKEDAMNALAAAGMPVKDVMIL